MRELTQLKCGLVVPHDKPKPPELLPGMIQDKQTRNRVDESLMEIVRSLGLDGNCGSVPAGSLDETGKQIAEYQVRAIGTFLLGNFDWEVKT